MAIITPPMRINDLMEFPPYEDFFLIHGRMIKQPRLLLPFHRIICKALTQVVLGTLPEGKQNLMLFMPPRHGKTFLVRDFIAWSMGIFPDSEYIYASYSSDLSASNTSLIKMTLEEDWYNYIFPDMALNRARGDFFTTLQDGCVYGTGVGGTITGFGAGKKRDEFGGAIILDDVMNAKDARSKAVKEGLIQWYDGVLTSRKNNDRTPIILIQQRLAPDDLPDHILKTEGDKWHVLLFAGLLPDGTALWEQVKSVDSLLRLKRIDPFTFYSQYQQVPEIEGGNMIKREWWKFHDAYTEGVNYKVNGLIFITADTAMKAKTMNDYTAMGAWHATGTHLDKLDLDRGKYEFPELLRRACAFWERWKGKGAEFFAIEDKVSGTSLGQMLAEKGIPIVLWKPQDFEFPEDKVGRVKMSTWYIEAGRIRMPANRPDISEKVIDECSAFSGSDSDTDDIVDEVTMAASIWKSKGGGLDIKVET